MALRLLGEQPIDREMTMKSSTPPQEPAKQPTGADRGAPATYAAHAVRKNLTVRVRVAPAPAENDELREHGYGHGV
jgi:hypothetical protein